MLFSLNNLLWVEGPGANGLSAVVQVKEMMHVAGLGLELQDSIALGGKKGDGLVCKADDPIEGQAVPQLPRAKPEDAMRMGVQRLLELPEDLCELRIKGHTGVVQIDLKDTIRTIHRTIVHDVNDLVAAADVTHGPGTALYQPPLIRTDHEDSLSVVPGVVPVGGHLLNHRIEVRPRGPWQMVEGVSNPLDNGMVLQSGIHIDLFKCHHIRAPCKRVMIRRGRTSRLAWFTAITSTAPRRLTDAV